MIFRVAVCAKTIIPAATIHVTSIEFVTVNLPIVKSAAARNESASCFSAGAPEAGEISCPRASEAKPPKATRAKTLSKSGNKTKIAIDHRAGRETALPETGQARPVPDGTGERLKAANDAHTEEHFASADKQLSGDFLGAKTPAKKRSERAAI